MDFLKFHPDGKYLYIELLATEYLRRQPDTPEAAKAIAEELKPMLNDVERFMEKNSMKEITVVNLKGVDLSDVNLKSAMNLITLLHNERPEMRYLVGIEIRGASDTFEIMYNTFKLGLPSAVRKIVKLVKS
jgi:hypothetical protein